MADTVSALTEETFELPANFRKLNARQKRDVLYRLLDLDTDELHASSPSDTLLDLAEVMVESAVGVMPIPLGIASGYLVDDELYNVPMAVEEPSVVAAASYAGRLIAANGGFVTRSTGPVMTAQIAIDGAGADAAELVRSREFDLRRELTELLAPMTKRGGGYRGMDVTRSDESGLLVVNLHLDVRDAMGANLINSAAELLRDPLEALSGGTVLMAILTNAAPRRISSAEFRLPAARLGRERFSGEEMVDRIVRANEFAQTDESRAVTHNKGIMNGVSALASATGNDSRAIEAAAHAYASRSGRYTALTEYRRDGNTLVGRLEIPTAMGTVGGAVGFHPVSTFAMKVLFMNAGREPSADRLSRVAVSLGLAQNLAALMALVSEGIQKGHMKQHARRLAWKAGARDEHIQELANRVWDHGVFNIETARRLHEELKRGAPLP